MNRYIKSVIASGVALAAGLLVTGVMAPAPVEAACAHEPESPVTIRYYSNATFGSEVGWYTQYCCSGTDFRSGSVTVYKKVRYFESCPSTVSSYEDVCYANNVEVACP